jgi:hypothetical protein
MLEVCLRSRTYSELIGFFRRNPTPPGFFAHRIRPRGVPCLTAGASFKYQNPIENPYGLLLRPPYGLLPRPQQTQAAHFKLPYRK